MATRRPSERATGTAHHLPTSANLTVLSMRAAGVPEKAIASELAISERAVRHHLERCRDDLECATTIEAVAIAVSLGLIRSPLPIGAALEGSRHIRGDPHQVRTS